MARGSRAARLHRGGAFLDALCAAWRGVLIIASKFRRKSVGPSPRSFGENRSVLAQATGIWSRARRRSSRATRSTKSPKNPGTAPASRRNAPASGIFRLCFLWGRAMLVFAASTCGPRTETVRSEPPLGISTSRPRRRRGSSPRHLHAAAPPRLVSAASARCSGAAARLRGIYTLQRRRRRGSSPRILHVAAAAPPRLVSAASERCSGGAAAARLHKIYTLRWRRHFVSAASPSPRPRRRRGFVGGILVRDERTPTSFLLP